MNSADQTAVRTEQIYLTRRSPHYWRVTFDIPPLNIFGPEGIPPLNEIISAVESDKYVRVVVFDSGIEGFFLTHYDFLAKAEGSTGVPPGPTAPALPDTPGLRHLTEGHPREDGPAGLLVGEGIPRNFASCGCSRPCAGAETTGAVRFVVRQRPRRFGVLYRVRTPRDWSGAL
jgi:hypothetical protein